MVKYPGRNKSGKSKFMEFGEKLQELRKLKGLTQEELAEILFVSRTAVSKWESGRGYPNIDSLKAIAKFFSVTVDELLSGEEILTIAEEDTKQKESGLRNLVFGILDFSIIMLLFLPFFGEKAEGIIKDVSLLNLTETSHWIITVYFVVVFGMALWGILTLIFRNSKIICEFNNKISLALNAAGAFVFIISLQPYAAGLLFVFFIIKALMLIKWR